MSRMSHCTLYSRRPTDMMFPGTISRVLEWTVVSVGPQEL